MGAYSGDSSTPHIAGYTCVKRHLQHSRTEHCRLSQTMHREI